MERHDGSEHGSAETYMIQGTELNPYLIATPPLEQIETMDSDGNPKFIFDQGLYYPAATNYYGYYCTGFESPGEWNDQQRFFGVDGPDLHYAGVQTENLPYVYYTPSYGYAQSPYNPYNPYIPGAIIGVDGSFVGTQPYYPGPPYQHPVSSPAYYPLAVQSRPDGILNSFQEPHSLNADASNGSGPHAAGSSQIAGGTRAELTDNGLSQSHPSGKSSEELKSNAAPIKQPAGFTSVTSGSVPHSASSQISQGKSVAGSTQAANQLLLGGVSSSRSSPIKVAPVGNVLPNFGSNGRGWAVDKLRPRLHYGGVSKNGNGNLDSLSEQNRGPRTNRSKSQWASSISVEAYNANVKSTTTQGNIIIHTDEYNKEDFPLNYADAKFFVIKSYSEDDVHKSIKYNVWSSTPNGNKRLDNAFEDAQRIAVEKPRGCPIFLFFSVNASGQFCGVAEMVGHVDFHKDMDFWQQDKWNGSFPVKWHMIKDVPNSNFRHIILENNENKPVTNSRDTQEIKRKQGLEMLSIFKNHALKTSILDDFIYYEERQRMIYEEKSRNLGKTYDSSLFVPAFVPGLVYQSPTLNDISSQSVPHEKAAISSNEQFSAKSENNDGGDANHVTSVLKIGSLTIHPKQAEAKSSVAVAEAKSSVAVAEAKSSVAVAEAKSSVAVAEAKTSVAVVEAKPSVAVVEAKPSVAAPRTEAIDVVTVGSMPIKVNGFTEASTSDVLTIGTIPIVPKAKFDKLSSSSSASGGARDI